MRFTVHKYWTGDLFCYGEILVLEEKKNTQHEKEKASKMSQKSEKTALILF